MNPDVRIADVWCSEKSGRLVTVVPASASRWKSTDDPRRDVFYRGVTGAVMNALAANFVRGRRLIERAGVRVGDVRETGKASTVKVLLIGGDTALCDTQDAAERFPLVDLAAMPLVVRDGKAVT